MSWSMAATPKKLLLNLTVLLKLDEAILRHMTIRLDGE